jgi:serine/threonine protein kinase
MKSVSTDDVPPPPPQVGSSHSPPMKILKLEAVRKEVHNRPLRDISTLDVKKMVGKGMYGSVFRAVDPFSKKELALKRLQRNPEEKKIHGYPITTTREIKMLKRLGQVTGNGAENIIRLREMIIAGEGLNDDNEKEGVVRYNKGDVFMVFEYMPFDLAGLIHTPDFHFTKEQVLWYSKQLLNGVFAMHSNKIINRDIKAANVLITRDNILKIADWGLARELNHDRNPQRLTGPRVITLWYRPPELLLECRSYGFEVDMWSVGCLLAEIVMKGALLKGSEEKQQLELIYKLCGTPTGELLEIYQRFPAWSKMKFEKDYPSTLDRRLSQLDPPMADLIKQILQMDPSKRIDAGTALDHDVFWDPNNPMVKSPKEYVQLSLYCVDCHVILCRVICTFYVKRGEDQP